MRNSRPELYPEGHRTRAELTPTGPPRRRRPFWATLAALSLFGGAALLGGWLGALAGLWVGRACALLRLGFSTGLTLGTVAGLLLAGLAILFTDPAER
jgi:hypothetical protein